jgi:hypothetical protein
VVATVAEDAAAAAQVAADKRVLRQVAGEQRFARAREMSAGDLADLAMQLNARLSLSLRLLDRVTVENNKEAKEAKEGKEDGGAAVGVEEEEELEEEEEEHEAGGKDDDDDDDDDDEGAAGLSAEAIRRELDGHVREWMLWITAFARASERSSAALEELIEWDLTQRRPSPKLAADHAATRRRAERALNAAQVSDAQLTNLADAHALFKKGTRCALEEWKRAADELKAATALGGNEVDRALARLEQAVAASSAARSAMALLVYRTLRPEQYARATLEFLPTIFRPSPFTEAAYRRAAARGLVCREEEEEEEDEGKEG